MSNTLGTLQIPCISVILPMSDHRGLAMAAVASWAKEQTGDQNIFEIVIVLDETCQPLEAYLRPMLRPHDVLLIVNRQNEIEQYHHGAMHAHGEYLFFTEPHCLAASDAITEMRRYVQTHSDDGFCAQSTPICRNRIAAMELRMFEEGWQTWSQEGHWCKVIMRGFGVRRNVYLKAGGFETRYNRFAEWLFAATLHVKGYRLGYAPNVCVQHAYGEQLKLFDTFIREFTEGECLFRWESSPEFCERFFSSPPEWDELREDNQRVSRMLRRILLQQLRTREGNAATLFGWQMALRAYFRLLCRELVGKRSQFLRIALLVWQAKLRCYLWWFHPDRMYRAFQDYWQQTTAFYRVKFLREHANQLEMNAPTPQTTYDMQHIAIEHLFGFHGLEQYDGRHFRWSSPTAALRVTLPPGDYYATVQLLNVRPLNPERDLTIFFNAMPIQNVTYDAPAATLRFSVSESMAATAPPHWLIVLCTPWRIDGQRPPEARLLGLPIVKIDFAEHAKQAERNARV